MAKKKYSQKKNLGTEPMQVPEVPISIKEIEAQKRLSLVKATCLLELLGNRFET